MGVLVFIVIVVVISVFVLKGFDKVAGRGPKQVKDGINSSKLIEKEDRVACPECAEMIKPEAKKCRFCGAEVKK